jgi:hypothetical protein
MGRAWAGFSRPEKPGFFRPGPNPARPVKCLGLLALVSGEGSPEPSSIRKNKPTESLLQLFHHTWASFCFPLLLQEEGFLRDMFPPFLYLSLVLICKHEEEAKIWSISHYEEQGKGKQDRRPASKIDLRARSICVCDFAYLAMKIWPHCNLLMYQ